MCIRDRYRVDQESLRLENLPETFELSVVTEICPEENTALEGLYKSGSMYCTQCEAEGFRNITYYLDQPDVLSVFTVDIEADAQRYPVALANGNKIEDTDLGKGAGVCAGTIRFQSPAICLRWLPVTCLWSTTAL